ncbi:MAG: N-acetylmuramoyl-L-alanine amidase [Pseudomonadota bacterium]
MKRQASHRLRPMLYRCGALASLTLATTVAWTTASHAQTKPHPACADRVLKVAIDIGHSPATVGAVSARGRSEYSFNRRFALELVARAKTQPDRPRTLRSARRPLKLDLFAIRPNAQRLGLKARTAIAARRQADLFLSIHHDSVQPRYLKTWTYQGKKRPYSEAFRGFSMFVYRGNPDFAGSLKLARLIAERFKGRGFTQTLHHAEPIKGENRKLLSWQYGIYDVNFAVLRTARTASVLLELGVIINPDDEAMVDRPETRRAHAQAILDALRAFCP